MVFTRMLVTFVVIGPVRGNLPSWLVGLWWLDHESLPELGEISCRSLHGGETQFGERDIDDSLEWYVSKKSVAVVMEAASGGK